MVFSLGHSVSVHRILPRIVQEHVLHPSPYGKLSPILNVPTLVRHCPESAAQHTLYITTFEYMNKCYNIYHMRDIFLYISHGLI